MLKKLCSPWVGSIMGLICYLGVTTATWKAATAHHGGALEATASDAPPHTIDQSPWMFNNVEVEGLVKELREEREALKKRETELNELKARLDSERSELNQLTQTVHRLQKDFDQSVSRVAEEETVNLRKLAKTYSGMEPEGAATIFKQMDDTAVVKIMMFMKELETGPILSALSKLGEADAKRAGDLTEKLRLAVVPKKK
jgi:flagellar motility protein MotE (MotC chaperone)